MNSEVFSRTETVLPQIDVGVYNLLIGMVLLWGFSINWLIVRTIPVSAIQAINPKIFLFGYFASCILGVYLFNGSDKPLVSFLGYNLVVVPFGLVLNLIIGAYEPTLVLEAVRLTGMVTFVMMTAGSLFPRFFERLGGTLACALLAIIVVELIETFFFNINHEWTDWVVVVIFCGYIGYDWSRANAIPKTVDNAIDSAAALYMDIINLFVRILRILGRK